MNGLIFFEDGTLVPFGTLTSVKKILQTANEVLPALYQQERDKMLNTISKEEMKQIAERLNNEHDSNI